MAAVDGFGEGNNVTIRISGSSADAVAAIANVNESLAQLMARSREASDAAANMGNTIGGGGFGGGGFGGGVTGMLSGLGEGIMGVVGHMGNFVSGWAQMQLALLGNQMFNDAANAVRNFAGALFDLNKQTETNVYSWRYTYGQGMSPGAALQNAQNISQWSQKFSYDVPFTRQDLMTSISGAAPLGLNLKGLEKYYPMIADLAATHINPMTGEPLDLGQAVMAIRGEMMGYARMLKYQLNINPEELVPYGLAFQGRGIGGHITDMTTLLPALQAYSTAQGWTKTNAQGKDVGAAFTTAHSTFWGEWSSWMDRVQNFELAGGEKMFAALKSDLEGISKWFDDNKTTMDHLADVFGTLLGKGVQGGTTIVQGVFQGLAGSGLGDTALTNIQKLTDWFSDPEHQKQLHDLGVAIGSNLGDAASKTGKAFGELADGIGRLTGALGGSKGGANIFQGLIDAFTSLPANLGRGLKPIADLLDLINAIQRGDFGAAWQDLQAYLQDVGSAFTWGAIPGSTPPPAASGQSGGSWGGEGRSRPFVPHYVGNPHNLGSSLYGASPGSLLGGLGSLTGGGMTGGTTPYQQGQSWVQQIAAGMQAARPQLQGHGQDIGQSIGEAIARGLGQSASGAKSGSGFEAAIKAIVQHELAVAEQSLAATPGAFFSRGTYGGQY